MQNERAFAHLLHTPQCLLLAGLSKLHVQHSLSGHTVPSQGYSVLCADKLSGVMVPGSDLQATMNASMDNATSAQPMNLHYTGNKHTVLVCVELDL